ncbi:IS110 family transposase [Salinarimonas sp. NSM]|uniref:IS110 family transposase n=1 Tax=Salinarimonas sp. NSM TaxID=3458003 RepID=UPI0040354273
MNATTIGLDLAKSIFQAHGVDASGAVVVQRRLKRQQVEGFFRRLPSTTVGLEACGSAHHWARVLTGLGHEVRMMPLQYVKPYVMRNKTDARDAAAICEAATRPTMRFVPIKTEAQQAGRGLHRVRDLMVRQRSQAMHAIRGLVAEFGVVDAKGASGGARLRAAILAGEIAVPELLREGLAVLARQWAALDEEIERLDRRIAAEAKADATARRLMVVPGIGPITAHAIVTGVTDPQRFRSARGFAAWLGLTPKQTSSADTIRSGSITKAGDRGLRRLFVLGGASLVASRRRAARSGPGSAAAMRSSPLTSWLDALLVRRKPKVAIVAAAAKLARIVWAMLTKNTDFRAAPMPA